MTPVLAAADVGRSSATSLDQRLELSLTSFDHAVPDISSGGTESGVDADSVRVGQAALANQPMTSKLGHRS
jgi:hypothetical protein